MSFMRVPTILVVSNDFLMQRFLRASLAVQNFDVLTCQRSAEAQDILTRLPFDLVLLDVTTHTLAGFDAIDPIRQVSDAPNIVLSTRAAVRDRERALRRGANGYLTKPFGVAELLSAVYVALGIEPEMR